MAQSERPVREHNPHRGMASRWITALTLRAEQRAPVDFDEQMAFDSARGRSDAEVRAELALSLAEIDACDARIRARGNVPIGAPVEQAQRVAA